MRLVGLATLSIEKDASNKLDMEEIIQEFAASKAREIKNYLTDKINNKMLIL